LTRTGSFIFSALLGMGLGSLGNSARAADVDRDNLMVVLRESIGANKKDDALKPSGIAKAKLPDGKEVELSPAWFEFIGDMHIRFVIDEPTTMRGISSEQLAALNLSPQEAVKLALANIKRVYGEPTATPWTGGLMAVKGKSPDLNSSYFLDLDFWNALLQKHPEGIVAAVPKRGGLVFTSISDVKAVEGLRKGINFLFSSSGSLRVSSALYLFKDGKWSVFQDPVNQ
jgi:hypothetical protein